MRFPLRPFDTLPHFNFMAWRHFWVVSSAILTLLAVVYTGVQGLNFGIDFVGGKLVQVQTVKALTVAEVREVVEKQGFTGVTIQEYGSDREYLIRLPGNDPKALDHAAEDTIVAGMAAVAGGADKRRVELVGPQVGEELRYKGFLAIAISVLAILVYIWSRFEMRYGLGAILALVHDVTLTVGIMALIKMEITLTVLAAILTLIGYSLNDTIVIFDRIRENRARYPNRPLTEVLNLSVNQTLARTFMTVATVMLVLVALYIWGGEVLRDFSLVLIIGVMLGTYSSVFVANPVLLALEEWYQKMAAEEAARRAGRKAE